MRRLGARGMVASPHYLATSTGYSVLRAGGHAVDAAIATNAVLAVVTPYLCGIGGDLFAQVYDSASGNLSGLNGSGRSGSAATLDHVRAGAGSTEMPERGALTVTVPGCVEAWGRLHERYGRLPWRELFTDAIQYAEHGFPVSAGFVEAIERSVPFMHPDTPAASVFHPEGMALKEAEIFRQPSLATTLVSISTHGSDAYYHGDIGRELVRTLHGLGGMLSEEDLHSHVSEWVEPLSVRYRDVDVYELPPNSQGIVTLMTLNMMQTFPSQSVRGERGIHRIAEAARLAYADREAYVTDVGHMQLQASSLLGSEYAEDRARSIREYASARASAGNPGDTAYMCAADEDGNLVSLIESNYQGIGSGIMAGSTGIMLHNRGARFSLDARHPNVIAPHKRTMHTLMPGMAFRHGKPWLVFGTMGGSTQAQIHAQLLSNVIDHSMKIDAAIDAPRFDAVCGVVHGRPRLKMESRFDNETVADLFARGHAVDLVQPFSSELGHAHAIQILDNGVYVGAADPRSEGLALGY